MRQAFPLILYSIRHHKGRSVVLVLCLALVVFLPFTVHRVVALLEKEMMGRAEATPILVGPPGSRFDLVLHGLHFREAGPGLVRQEEWWAVKESGRGAAYPLFGRYSARGFPIIGTSLDYLRFRGLEMAAGYPFSLLGECVIGYDVARQLGLEPGDVLSSNPENLFDLGGSFPLAMQVAGVLRRSYSPDDGAVFVDLRTAWVMAGIGHGHRTEEGATLPLEYTRITPENVETFHFHGDPADFPLTAIIVVPRDERGAALLLGRYFGAGKTYQAVRSVEVVEELLGMMAHLRRFFDLHYLFLLCSTLGLAALVLLLSLRLRRREIETMQCLGCRRGTIVFLVAGEWFLLLAGAAVIALLAGGVATHAAWLWLSTLVG
jgi:putative ABC transport system permease protein